MALILNIHTATGTAIVTLSQDGKTIGVDTNRDQKEHAVFLHPSISKLLTSSGITPRHLEAICVTEGPGSYTGIRVGLAAAKGLCFALDIPMVMLNTLYAMALTAAREKPHPGAFYCPMIDARRMEVYMALYDSELTEVIASRAQILDSSFLTSITSGRKVFFSGDGCSKMRTFMKGGEEQILATDISPEVLSDISFLHFKQGKFSNIIYSKPLYLKEFYTPAKNND